MTHKKSSGKSSYPFVFSNAFIPAPGFKVVQRGFPGAKALKKIASQQPKFAANMRRNTQNCRGK